MRKIVEAIFIKSVNICYLLIMAYLFFISIFLHCELNIYSASEVRNLERHTWSVYFLFFSVGTIFIIFLWKYIDKYVMSNDKIEKWGKYAVIGSGIIVGVLGAVWCVFYDGVPQNDQKDVLIEAQKIANYSEVPFDIAYAEGYPRLKGLILCMSLAMKLFGNTPNAWRFFNIVGAVFLVIGITKCAYTVWNNRVQAIFVCLLSMSFFPIIIYTAFHYGTLLAVTFTVWACYGVFSFVAKRHWKYCLLTAICFALGIQMHQSVAIAIVAAIIYLLLNVTKDKWEYLVGIISIVIAVICMNSLVGATYSRITGYEFQSEKAVSAVEYMYMGLTSDTKEGGPGTIDGSHTKFRELYPDDLEKAKETARDAVITVIAEYINGTRDIEFFVRKANYQWLDPTFGARKTIILNDVENGQPQHTEQFYNFYYGSIRQYAFKYLNILMIMVYFFAAISGVTTLARKSNADIHFFVQIYFLGGFVFQLLWESLSRYCFPYYIWLIPEALFGVAILADKIRFKKSI